MVLRLCLPDRIKLVFVHGAFGVTISKSQLPHVQLEAAVGGFLLGDAVKELSQRSASGFSDLRFQCRDCFLDDTGLFVAPLLLPVRLETTPLVQVIEHAANLGQREPFIEAFSAQGKPTWLSFDPNTGELTGTPGVGDIGTTGNDVVIEATNSEGTDTQSFTIDVSGVAPSFTSTPVQFATIGVPYSETIAAVGIPAPALNDITLPGWLSFDPNTGLLSGTPAASDFGTAGNDVEIEADNGWGTATQAFIIQVNGVVPQVVTTAGTIAVTGQVYTYTVQATGNPTPTFSVIGLPTWLSFDNVDTISGTPLEAHIGQTGSITITASNAEGTDDEVFQIDVQGLPPQITSVPVLTATGGSGYSYTVTATGIPAPTLSASGLPGWLSFNTTTGELSGTPSNSDEGVNGPITITADNGWGPVATQTFSITVDKAINSDNKDSGGCASNVSGSGIPIAASMLLMFALYVRRKRRHTGLATRD